MFSAVADPLHLHDLPVSSQTKAQNGQDRIIAHRLTENHMKGTSVLEGWHNLLHRVTPCLNI